MRGEGCLVLGVGREVHDGGGGQLEKAEVEAREERYQRREPPLAHDLHLRCDSGLRVQALGFRV